MRMAMAGVWDGTPYSYGAIESPIFPDSIIPRTPESALAAVAELGSGLPNAVAIHSPNLQIIIKPVPYMSSFRIFIY